MAAITVEERLRGFLFALAAAMCLGTIVELFLANHTKQAIQWLPFALCAAGLAAGDVHAVSRQHRTVVADGIERPHPASGLLEDNGEALGLFTWLAGQLVDADAGGG